MALVQTRRIAPTPAERAALAAAAGIAAWVAARMERRSERAARALARMHADAAAARARDELTTRAHGLGLR